MRCVLQWFFICLIGLASSFSTRALGASTEILKVLPHWLDRQGRHTVSPSLFERDAYQLHLKEHREEVSTIRFDVNWRLKERGLQGCTLHLEARFGSEEGIQTLEQKTLIETGKRRKKGWSGLRIPEASFDVQSNLIAWRVRVMRGDEVLATRTSFLW